MEKSDVGNASILTIIATIVLVMVLALSATVMQFVSIRRDVHGAADLSSLAGASTLLESPSGVCDAVNRIAMANHVDVVGCENSDTTVSVTVSRTIQLWHRWIHVQSTARAGVS